MNRSVFPFVIGYQGLTAIVDRGLHQKWANASTDKLLDAGLFKVAFARAVWDKDEATKQAVLTAYNALTPKPYPNVEALQRAFGVYQVPEGVKRVLLL